MANKFQQQVKRVITDAGNLHPDRIVCKKDGTVEVRFGFFYRHGQTAELWGDKVQNCVNQVVAAEVTHCREVWQAWPKDSYWAITVSQKS
jgi:hypothetical protein